MDKGKKRLTTKGFRPHIIFSKLNHAWCNGTRCMKKSTKIKIVGEDHIFMIPSPSHDLSIWCICRTKIAPVQSFMPTGGEQRNPVRRQVYTSRIFKPSGEERRAPRNAMRRK